MCMCVLFVQFPKKLSFNNLTNSAITNDWTLFDPFALQLKSSIEHFGGFTLGTAARKKKKHKLFNSSYEAKNTLNVSIHQLEWQTFSVRETSLQWVLRQMARLLTRQPCFLYFKEKHGSLRDHSFPIPKSSSLVFRYSKQTSLSAAYVQTVMRKGYFTDNVKYRFQTPTKYTLKHFIICTGCLAKRTPNTFHWSSWSPTSNE